MKHSERSANRVAKKLWKLGWGLVFVSTMTVLSMLGAGSMGYSKQSIAAKSLSPPAAGTYTSAQR